MDKYLNKFAPYMKKWLSEHYSETEADKRWEKTKFLYNKWMREEGDLGGRNNNSFGRIYHSGNAVSFELCCGRYDICCRRRTYPGNVFGRTLKYRGYYVFSRLYNDDDT